MHACPHSQTPRLRLRALIHKAFAVDFRPLEHTDSTIQCINEINHLRGGFERRGAA